MSLLTPRKRELVSLGAAMGSKLHLLQRAPHPGVEKGWGNGYADLGATRLAGNPRNVSARSTPDAGLELLPESTPAVQAHKPCCG